VFSASPSDGQVRIAIHPFDQHQTALLWPREHLGTGSGSAVVIGAADCATMPITAPVELDEPSSSTDVAPDSPWIVLVWNDPINLMSYVSFVFRKLFGYSKEKADRLMMDVHEKGRAVVSNGTREKAELDVFRLHEYGLWATMQQDTA
jgi:ATP-dependent Clp protease adaptor protein ClpS